MYWSIMTILDWPLPLIGRSLLSQGFPGLPLQDAPGQCQLILGLDDDLLNLSHPNLLLSLLNGVALLQDGNTFIDQTLCVFSVSIVSWHLGKGSQVLTKINKVHNIS